MSLDVWLTDGVCGHCGRGGVTLFDANVTHNLSAMAEAAGIYKALWRPEELGITKAGQLVEPLKSGLAWLKANEAEARTHDSPNGWGLYVHFVPWVERYLAACEKYPDATIGVSR
jgi:hypothetical protein